MPRVIFQKIGSITDDSPLLKFLDELLTGEYNARSLDLNFFRMYARPLLPSHSDFDDYIAFSASRLHRAPDVIHNFILPRFISRAISSGDYFAAVYVSAVQRDFRELETVIVLGQISRDSATSSALRNYPECELAERYVCRSTLTSSNFNRFCARSGFLGSPSTVYYFPASDVFSPFSLSISREICDARRSSKSRSQNG